MAINFPLIRWTIMGSDFQITIIAAVNLLPFIIFGMLLLKDKKELDASHKKTDSKKESVIQFHPSTQACRPPCCGPCSLAPAGSDRHCRCDR